jgi:hypothetical protein
MIKKKKAQGTQFPQPMAVSVIPASGEVSTAVAISGANFSSGVYQVDFSGIVSTFTVVSDSEISTTVPAGAATGLVNVTGPGGVNGTAFTVSGSQAPSIVSLSTTFGIAGTDITITGNHFAGATSVKFAGVDASFSVDSDQQITATIPTSFQNGTISVTTPDGTGTGPTFYTIVTRSVPLPESDNTYSNVVYIGDLDDIIICESNALDLSAVYQFEFSIDNVNWFVIGVATTVHDTETAFWKIYGDVVGPTVGKANVNVPRANYWRMKTNTYTGGSMTVFVQGKALS